jgi:hypothetical protein
MLTCWKRHEVVILKVPHASRKWAGLNPQGWETFPSSRTKVRDVNTFVAWLKRNTKQIMKEVMEFFKKLSIYQLIVLSCRWGNWGTEGKIICSVLQSTLVPKSNWSKIISNLVQGNVHWMQGFIHPVWSLAPVLTLQETNEAPWSACWNKVSL